MRSPAPWLRRVATIPAYGVAWIVAVASCGVWLPVAVLIDRIRPGPAVALRCGALLLVYLTLELVGLLVALGLSLARGAGGMDREAWLDRHFRLQSWWASTLLRALLRLFQMRLQVEGDGCLARGPYLLFVRHSSIADTLLASLLVSRRHGMRLRYILKRELLWDPCLDLVGNRLPNAFVARDSEDSAQEVGRVAQLARELGVRDAVLIYPEGTRFTPAKRSRVLERLQQEGKRELHAYARTLQWVLPPRLGGPLGLLEAAPDADVVFCAHVGFDRAATLGEVWGGALLGATLRVQFRRVERARIPDGSADRQRWLQEEWRREDVWVGGHRAT